jgi:hypothetical protein
MAGCMENKKQFTPEQIKMARRLNYLLNLRDKDPIRYRNIGGGKEKEEFYVRHPEIVPLAVQYYSRSVKV